MELLDGMVDASTPPPKQAPEEEDALDTDEVSGDPGSDPQPQVSTHRSEPVFGTRSAAS